MVNSPMTIARVRNAPLSSATRRLGKITRKRIVPQPGAQALGRLGQGAHVDRAQAGVHRPVHVGQRQHHVGGHQQDVGADVGVGQGQRPPL